MIEKRIYKEIIIEIGNNLNELIIACQKEISLGSCGAQNILDILERIISVAVNKDEE